MTFMSKDVVNKVVDVLKMVIKSTIADEVKRGRHVFSAD